MEERVNLYVFGEKTNSRILPTIPFIYEMYNPLQPLKRHFQPIINALEPAIVNLTKNIDQE